MLEIGTVLGELSTRRLLEDGLRRLAEHQREKPPRLLNHRTLDDLRDVAARRAFSAVVIEPTQIGSEPDRAFRERDLSDDLPTGLSKWLRSQRGVPTVLWASRSWLHPRRVIRLARLGLSEVVVHGEGDTPEVWSQVIAGMVHQRRTDSLLAVLPPDLPNDLRGLIERLAVPGAKQVFTSQMAAMIHCDRATLFRKFRRAGLPPPGELMGWIRIYLALSLLEEGVDPESAAFRVGFSSTGGLSGMVSRRMGRHSLRQIRQVGSEGILRALLAVCSSSALDFSGRNDCDSG